MKQVKNQRSNNGDNISTSSILKRLIVQLQQQISISTEQLDRKDKVINTSPKKLERKGNIEPLSYRSPTKVSLLQEKQNGTQQRKPNQSNMTPSAQNNELTFKSTTPPVKSTDPSPKITGASSNSKDKREHTMGNLEYAQTIVNDNAINQDKVQKNHKEKEKSTIIIGDSVIKHRNGWKI